MTEAQSTVPLLPPKEGPVQRSLLHRLFRGYWDSCTCTALTGAATICCGKTAIKVLADDDVSVFQITIIRSLIPLPFLMGLGYYKTGYVLGPLNRNMKWIFLRAMGAATGFVLGMVALSMLPVSEVSLYTNSYPAVLAVMLWLLSIERADWLSAVGIVGTLLGNVLTANPPFLFGGDSGDWDRERVLGIGCAALTVLSLSAGFVFVLFVDRDIPSVVFANHVAILSTLISVPFVIAGYPKGNEWRPSLEHMGLYGLASLSTVNQVFVNRAFQIGPPIKASVITLSRMLMLVGSGALVLGEDVSVTMGIGAGVVVGSIALVVWSRNRQKQKRQQELLLENEDAQA